MIKKFDMSKITLEDSFKLIKAILPNKNLHIINNETTRHDGKMPLLYETKYGIYQYAEYDYKKNSLFLMFFDHFGYMINNYECGQEYMVYLYEDHYVVKHNKEIVNDSVMLNKQQYVKLLKKIFYEKDAQWSVDR